MITGTIKVKFHILLILLIAFLLGCNQKKEKIEGKKSLTLDEQFNPLGFNNDLIEYLPDTISIGDALEGHFMYRSAHDTIKVDTTSLRIVDLLLAKTEWHSENLEEFKTKDYKTFIRIRDSIIPVFDLTVDRKGFNYFEGYIVDELYLPENKDAYRKKTINRHLFFRVYVE